MTWRRTHVRQRCPCQPVQSTPPRLGARARLLHGLGLELVEHDGLDGELLLQQLPARLLRKQSMLSMLLFMTKAEYTSRISLA